MKKLILIITAVTTLSNISKSQETSADVRQRFIAGAKVGANYSNVYDSQGETFHADAKFGLATGVFLAIPIGKYFGIQPEALFSQKGFQAGGIINGSGYSVTRTTDYIDIPLLFAIKPSEFFTIVAGPQYSYLLKQTDVFANSTTSIAQETTFENDNVRKNTLCFTGGFDITVKHFVFGARVGWDILNNNGDNSSTTPRYKNTWYQATIGYRLYKS